MRQDGARSVGAAAHIAAEPQWEAARSTAGLGAGKTSVQAQALPRGSLPLMGVARPGPRGGRTMVGVSGAGWEAIGSYATTITLPAIGAALAKRVGGFVRQVGSAGLVAGLVGCEGPGQSWEGSRQARPQQVWGPGPSGCWLLAPLGPHARAAAARAAAQRGGKLLQRAAQAAQAAAEPPLAAAQRAGLNAAAALGRQGLGGGGCRAAHAVDGAGGAGQRQVLWRGRGKGAGMGGLVGRWWERQPSADYGARASTAHSTQTALPCCPCRPCTSPARNQTQHLTLSSRHCAGDAGGGEAARRRHAGAVHSGVIGARPLQRQQAAVVYASGYEGGGHGASLVSLGWGCRRAAQGRPGMEHGLRSCAPCGTGHAWHTAQAAQLGTGGTTLPCTMGPSRPPSLRSRVSPCPVG